MNPNRFLSPGPHGEHVFRDGRHYRLLVVVNGPCYAEDLEEELGARGFIAIASSTPDTWTEDKPSDWPTEAPPRIAQNECLVRVSAVFEGDAARVDRDLPIGASEASFSIAQAWDYGPAERVGAAPPATAPAPKERSPLFVVGAAIAAFGGLGLWNYYSAQKRAEREQKRLETAEAAENQARLHREMQALLERGHSHDEAAAILEAREDDHESEPAVIYVVGG